MFGSFIAASLPVVFLAAMSSCGGAETPEPRTPQRESK